MRPRDLLAFAQMHMSAGRAADGTVVLQPETVRLMHEPSVELPRLGLMGDAWGLGPELFRTPDGLVDRPRRQHHRAGGLPALRASTRGSRWRS